jgi:hypothetical protein
VTRRKGAGLPPAEDYEAMYAATDRYRARFGEAALVYQLMAVSAAIDLEATARTSGALVRRRAGGGGPAGAGRWPSPRYLVAAQPPVSGGPVAARPPANLGGGRHGRPVLLGSRRPGCRPALRRVPWG